MSIPLVGLQYHFFWLIIDLFMNIFFSFVYVLLSHSFAGLFIHSLFTQVVQFT